MKMRMHKLIIILGLLSSFLFMSACGRGRNEPEKVVTLYNNTWIMEKYMNGIQEYDHVIYEQVYFDWGGRSIGPTEYRFRGILYLTDDEAERIWNEYEWDKTDAPQFEFEKVGVDFVGNGPWYSSQQFNKDNYSTLNVNFSVFDGKKLVFDVNQI